MLKSKKRNRRGACNGSRALGHLAFARRVARETHAILEEVDEVGDEGDDDEEDQDDQEDDDVALHGCEELVLE